MRNWIAAFILLCPALKARADISDSGSLSLGGQATVVGSMTVTASGATQYSLGTSSGISVAAGGVKAPFFSGVYYGNGANLSLTNTFTSSVTIKSAFDVLDNPSYGFFVSGSSAAVDGTSGSTPPMFLGRALGGTRASPSAIASDITLLSLSGTGYDGSTYPAVGGTPAQLLAVSSGAWTTSNHGTYWTLSTTPLGSTTYAERLRVTDAGNVGIGTTAPDEMLSVNGGADKAAGGATWGTFSDGRLKDVDGSYDRGLAEIMKLDPVRFHYKDGNAIGLPHDEEELGFVAQDVQKVIPEAVSATATKDSYLMMHADPILWAMLNAIKQQQREIETRDKQIANLQGRVQALEASSSGSSPF